MASLAAAGAYEAMDAKETEQQLERMLVFAFPEEAKKTKKPLLSKIFGSKEETVVRPDIVSVPGGFSDPIKKPQVIYTLEEYEKILDREDREEPLIEVAGKLSALRARAYPLYRPLIYSYEQLLQDMIKGAKEKDVAKRIDSLSVARMETLTQARGVESYMDWFEGTQVRSKSGAFDDYGRAVRELEKLDTIKRRDRISRYLDAIEGEY